MNYILRTCVVLLVVWVCAPLPTTRAQESMTIGVTPPLIQIAVEPGDFWQSSVKIINSNPYELTVFANVVNFEASGEAGHGRFIPLVNQELDAATLAGWLSVTKDPIVIPREQSVEVPFSLTVPQDASPGGHFAAILVGTQPPKDENMPVAVQTSQVVTSLFFVRVGGEVIESGDIREFSVARAFRDTPEADFVLRFENKGNVHLQPLGEIAIYNMWGKERGFIPINQKTNFGNVLPESIRKFEFTWKGESSLSDIGRYKAVVTLGYGDEHKSFVSRTVHFYVVPLKATAITLVSLIAFFFFMSWAIRRYIRRAIYLAGYDEVPVPRASSTAKKQKTVVLDTKRHARDYSAPLRAGVIDLRKGMKNEKTYGGRLNALFAFVRLYKLFFVSAVVLLVSLTASGFYLSDVLSDEKSYEITIDKDGEDVTITSEEVIKERLDDTTTESPASDAVDQSYTLTLTNASSIPGTAAATALLIEEMGYRVDAITSDTTRSQERTVIVYSPSLTSEAVRLSEQLGNVLISARTDESATSTPTITVVVGEDRSE